MPMTQFLSGAREVLFQIHSILDITASPIYLALTLIVWASFLFPFLQDLASHGKTRNDDSGSSNKLEENESPPHSLSSRLIDIWNGFTNCILRGEFFLVPKRYFLHFYISGIISTICLLGMKKNLSSQITYPAHYVEQQQVIPLVLLCIHLLRRCYECCFVHKWISNSKMHVAGYLLGIVHYVLLPTCFIPIIHDKETRGYGEFLDDHIAQGFVEENHQVASFALGMQSLCAAILCLIAQYEQYYHHDILANLRRDTKKKKGNDNQNRDYYQIPLERGFQLISCPHYLAEIIIYVAFFVLLQHGRGKNNQDHFLFFSNNSWDSRIAKDIILKQLLSLRDLRPTILLFWVSSNLIVSALNTHEWYTRNCQEYKASKRKAVFPFLL